MITGKLSSKWKCLLFCDFAHLSDWVAATMWRNKCSTSKMTSSPKISKLVGSLSKLPCHCKQITQFIKSFVLRWLNRHKQKTSVNSFTNIGWGSWTKQHWHLLTDKQTIRFKPFSFHICSAKPTRSFSKHRWYNYTSTKLDHFNKSIHLKWYTRHIPEPMYYTWYQIISLVWTPRR